MATIQATHRRALAGSHSIRPAVAWGVILLGIAAVYALLLREGHAWGDDFSMYILHARSIVEGRAFTDTPYIYNADYAFLGPPSYPPITSVLLAPIYYFAGLDLIAMKSLMIGTFVAALAFCALSFYKRLRAEHMALLLVLVGLNIFFLRGMTSIGSDAPFLMFLYLTLWLIEQVERDREGATRPTIAAGVAVGVAIYLAYGTRTVGAVLLPTLWVTDLVRWRRPSRAAITATAVFALLAVAQNSVIRPTSGGYSDQLAFEPMVLLHNAALYASRMVAFWSNGYWTPLAAAMCLVFTALAALGYFRSLRERIGVLEVFPVLYLGVILLFPSYQGERFLLPVLPLYVFYALVGLESPWFSSSDERVAAKQPPVAPRHRRWLGHSLALCVGPALIGAALVSTVARVTAFDFGPIAEGPHRAESVALFDFIREHTEPTDVIVFAKPRALALSTSRPAAAYHRAANDQQLWSFLYRIGARYVVSFETDRPLFDGDERMMAQYLREFIARNGARLVEVYANPDFRVYEIHSRAAGERAPRTSRVLVPILVQPTEFKS